MAKNTVVWLGGQDADRIVMPIDEINIPAVEDIVQSVKPGVNIDEWKKGVDMIFDVWKIAIHLKQHIVDS